MDVIHLAGKFDRHNVLVIVGDNDARIDTDHAIAVARRVSRVAHNANVELHVLKDGHSALDGLTDLSKTSLARQLDQRDP